ncbi:aldo/keto reductase [Holzapfeliella sp. JNUCC 72]
MSFDLSTRITLNNGTSIPQMGLGVWKSNNTQAKEAVMLGLKHGYEMFDTAKQYGNERGVGEGLVEGLKAVGKTREDIFLTTKIFGGDQGYQETLDAIDGQLERLQTDYVDLLLVHWPVTGKYVDTWRAVEEIYKAGKARAIGVSNFDNERMQNLLDHATIIPAVNQMEYNPLIQERDILAFNQQHGIHLQAWSPLGGGAVLTDPELQKIADKYNKTIAQVVLRWNFQSGIITIPKSVHEERIQQNADIFDFELSAQDMQKLYSMNQEKRSLWYNDFSWEGGSINEAVEEWGD